MMATASEGAGPMMGHAVHGRARSAAPPWLGSVRSAAVWGQDPIDPALRQRHLGVMARVLVLVSPPRHLKVDEAEDWLRQELVPVIRTAGLRTAALSRLASASSRWPHEWGWLAEFDFETVDRAREALHDDAWAMLLGDLRLLGMAPTVALLSSENDLMP